ncbi:MAG TPA: HD domain-containing protein [Syntrophales bacterium]|nr:HD domain-containing protein [Syntrophales bacterium]
MIKPHESILNYMDATTGIYRIIELLDREGGCPSVVDTGKRRGPEDEYPKLYDILKKVTLRSHSYRVARLSMELLAKDYLEYDYLIPVTLVAALGHDIGKIPSLRTPGHYTTGEHAVVSEAVIKEIYREHYMAIESATDEETRGYCGQRVKWIDDAREAILNHHRRSTEGFTARLRKADGRAREMEVAEIAGGSLKVRPWAEWFVPDYYLRSYVKPYVNVLDSERNWKALAYGSVVYCEPSLLFDTAMKYAQDAGVVCSSLFRATDKEAVLKDIVDSLKTIDAVSPELGRAYSTRLYTVELAGGRKLKKSYVPLKIEAIGRPAELDRTKDRFFHSIKGIRPFTIKSGGVA